MKWQRLLCLLLVFVFIFCGLFSVSAFAYEVNGHTVNTYYASDLSEVQFTTTITSSETKDNLNIKIKVSLDEVITENSIFDLKLNFDSSPFGSCDTVHYFLFNENIEVISEGEATISDKSIILNDIIVDGGNCSYLQFNIVINSPTWNENIVEDPPVEKQFMFDGRYYTFIDGMTWSDFCDSDYNPYGNFYYNQYGVYYLSTSKPVHWTHTTGKYTYASPATSQAVKSSDPIDALSSDTASVSYVLPVSSVTYTFNFTVTDFILDVTVAQEEHSGIIGWIKNTFNAITNLPTYIASKLQSYFNAIGQGLIDLGNTLLDGIKSLFIPSEEDITFFKDKMEYLLYDKLGAVGEAGSIIAEFADNFKEDNVETQNNTTIPSVTVNLSGTNFTFGGYTVDFVPNGFEFLVDSLKLITNILATFMVINSLKRRFEEVLSK